jgi:PIN domain nuclease of toxin-antitoxin system
MRILLDTHVFLWFINNDSKLSRDYLDVITDPIHDIYLSVVSVWEAAIKHSLGKLPLPSAATLFIPQQRIAHGIASIAVEEADIAVLAGLPPLHRDPFDRIMIAQALRHDMIIATVDGAIRQYPVNCL